jgi:hypothetical protein
MLKRVHYFLFLLFLTISSTYAQEKITMDGYISNTFSLYGIEDVTLWENSFMDRFNFRVYPTNWLTGAIDFRSRIITGNTLTTIPGYSDGLGNDPGYMNMTLLDNGNIGKNAGYALTTVVDRLWLQFTFGNLEAIVGRQRINWGQTLVWNPNDIFNSYSYFEVDYPERPGSDAIRLQYYTGNASTIELVAKTDSSKRVTAAGYFRFNTLGFDIQLLGGVYQEEDLFLGAGWSGNLGPTGFRGELSYFRDLGQFSDTTGYLMASTGFDYTFSNSFMIQAEALYSALAKEMDINNFLQFYGGNLDVKTLGFTPWTFFLNLSYPITPLLTASMASMWYPAWDGFFLGPSLDLSIRSNMALSLIFQYFSAEFENSSGGLVRSNNTFGFLRFKWNF